MSELDISVLGSLRVLQNGRAVELGPGRRRAFLAALVVDVDRTVQFDTVVDRVWGDDTPDKPMASIHAYVSRLRAALRSVDADGHDLPSPLLTEPAGYRLAVDPLSIDAVRFERLLADADNARMLARLVDARELVSKALELWRGPAYLDIRAPFADAEAERLNGVRSRAEELAISLDMELGRDAAVIPRLESLVAVEPFREALQSALMLALYRTGRQAEALQRYQLVRTLLADELGVDPAPELRNLHERMLNQDPTLAPAPPPGVLVGSSARADSPVPEPDAQPVRAQLRMIGRAAEQQRLEDTIAEAWTTGSTIAAAVVGEAGIGKSRLVDEVAAWATARAGTVAWGRCWPHDGAPPLWPWLQLVTSVAATFPDDVVIAAIRDRAATIRAPLPDLPGEPVAPSTAGDSASMAQSQVRQFDAITAFVEHLAAYRPLLLIVEDMHWADEASRKLAEYFVTQVSGRNVALLCSVRSPNEDPGIAGAELLGALARTGRCERVTLRGLSTADVQEYVRDRTSADLDETTAQRLVDRTAGNPFFVGEIVRLLVTDAYADASDNGTSVRTDIPAEVPDTVREVILQRLRRLDEDEQTVLRVAAVVGPGFDLELIERVSRLSDDAVDEAVDLATTTGFLCSDPDSPGRHRFTHALVQQAIAEDIGPARRTRLHGRIAETLQARVGADALAFADDIVYHLVATGLELNIGRAVDMIIKQSDAAMARASYPEVDALLMRALGLVGRISGTDAESRELSVLVRLTSLHDLVHGPALPMAVGLPTTASALRRRAVELARRQTGERDLLAALTGSWALAIGTADFVGAWAAVDELAVVAEATEDEQLRAVAQYFAGTILIQQGRFREAEARLGLVIDYLSVHSTTTLATVLSSPIEAAWGWRAVARAVLGDLDGVSADLAANARLIGHENPSIDVNTSGCVAVAQTVLGDHAAVLVGGDHAVAAAEKAGLLAAASYIAIFRNWARARLDPAATDVLRASVAVLGDGPTVLWRPYLNSLLADVLERSGEPVAIAEAWDLLDRGVAEVRRTGNLFGLPHLHTVRARILRRRGDESGAALEEKLATEIAEAQTR